MAAAYTQYTFQSNVLIACFPIHVKHFQRPSEDFLGLDSIRLTHSKPEKSRLRFFLVLVVHSEHLFHISF